MSRLSSIFSGENKNTEEYIALRNEINTRLTLKQQISDTVFDRFMVFLPILITVTTAVPLLVKDKIEASEGTEFIFDILPPVLLLLLAIYVFYSFLRYDENWNQILAIAMYSIIISDRPKESPLMVWERGLFVQELEDSKIHNNTLNIEKPGRIRSLYNKEFALCLCAVAILLEIYLCAYFIDTGIPSQRILEGVYSFIAIFTALCFCVGLFFAQKNCLRLWCICLFILLFASLLFKCCCLTVWMYIIAIAATSAAAGYVWEKSNPKHHTETKLKLLIKWWEYAVKHGIRSDKELVELFQKPDCEVCAVVKLDTAVPCFFGDRNDCTLAKIRTQYRQTHQSQPQS